MAASAVIDPAGVGIRRPGMAELQHIATFCGSCDCGCPELYIDPSAEDDKRLVITDVAAVFGVWGFTTRHSATADVVEGWAMPNARDSDLVARRQRHPRR